jgi:hypothetical protein
VKRAGPVAWSFQEEIRQQGGTLTTSRYTITKLGDDQSRAEAQEVKIDGKEQPLWKMELKRKKERPRPAQGAAKDTPRPADLTERKKPSKQQAGKQEMTAAERAFRELGDWEAGGVWESTGSDGSTSEERWEWVLNKSFLTNNWKIGKDTGLSIAGTDPATGKLACWEFDDQGRVWKGTITADKDALSWSSEGQGKKGRSTWKSRTTKVGPDEWRSELLEQIEDGKKLPGKTTVGKRKR